MLRFLSRNMSYVLFENKLKIPFYESISLKCSKNLKNNISVEQLDDGNVNIFLTDPMSSNTSIPLRRPSFCPFAILKERNKGELPITKHQWIAVACVVFLENKNHLILLTKRASHMRTFANVWVAPGGHVESKETLEAAALRELMEETGLQLSMKDVEFKLLCAWESTYPTCIDFGMPKSHNLVLYFRVIVKNDAIDLDALTVNPDEVSAYCWLNKAKVAEIVKTFNDPLDLSWINNYSKTEDDDFFECFEVVSTGSTIEYNKVLRSLSVLTASVPDIRQLGLIPERVSTGTKYGLYEWLKSCSNS